MRTLLIAAIAALAASPSLACNYQSGDGLTVTFPDGESVVIESAGDTMSCTVQQTEFQTMKVVECPGFSSDLFMIPSQMGGEFPDIIYMPPNVLYWGCE